MARDIKIELVYTHFGAIGAGMMQRVDQVCDTTAHAIQGYAQHLIASPPKSGHVYKRGNVLHQASAPGEAPATDTGQLYNSAYAVRRGRADWEIGFTAEYAEGLEFGTPGGKIDPRPFLRPAVAHYREAFFSALRALLGG